MTNKKPKAPPGKAKHAAARAAPQRSLLRLHPRLLVGVVVALVIATSVLPVALARHQVPPPTQPRHKAVVTKQAPKKAAAPAAPAPAKPAPTPAPKPTPAPVKPAIPPSPAPTVSSVAATPGSGASSLTPTPAAAAPATPANTASASSGSTTSSSTLPPADAAYDSLNWAGYFMSGASYTGVSGAWTVPNPTGNGTSTSADATWIGIGGATTQDLVQVGTSNFVDASGAVSSTVFYELLPDSPVYPSTITISPGDSMTASLQEQSPGQWLVTIADTTEGEIFSTTVSYTSSHTSAEWIEEDPSFASGGLVPFDGFGTAHFRAASAVAGGSTVSLLSGNANAIAMVTNNDSPVATPSILGSDGASFNVVKN